MARITDNYALDRFYEVFMRATPQDRRGIIRGLQTIADGMAVIEPEPAAEPEPTAEIGKLPLTDEQFAELAGGVAL